MYTMNMCSLVLRPRLLEKTSVARGATVAATGAHCAASMRANADPGRCWDDRLGAPHDQEQEDQLAKTQQET